MTLPGGRRIVADAIWSEERVVVELDVTATHGSERSFHEDRARDRELQAMGWATVRVTDRHLDRDGRRLGADLRELLTADRAPTTRSARPPAAR